MTSFNKENYNVDKSSCRTVICKKAETFVELEVPHSMLETISNLLHPFISVESNKVRSKNDKIWRLSVAPPEVPTLNYENVKLKMNGEPEFTLLFSPQFRHVIIPSTISYAFSVQLAYRWVRILLRQIKFDSQDLFLHAGMVSLNSVGIAVVGDKRAGKTSTILSLLKHENAAFVSNDDLSIRHTDGKCVGYGWPRSISVRKDTVSLLELPIGKDQGEEKLRHPANLTSWTHLSSFEAEIGLEFIYPSELQKILNCRLLPHHNVQILLFPRFLERDSLDVRLRKINREEIAALLSKNILQSPNKNTFLKNHFRRPSEAFLREGVSNVATSVSGFVLEQGFSNVVSGSKLVAEACRNFLTN